MLFFKRSLKKKILATDGYVEEPLETRIHIGRPSGQQCRTKYICCVFYFSGSFTEVHTGWFRKPSKSTWDTFAEFVLFRGGRRPVRRKEKSLWDTKQTLKSHRNAKWNRSPRSQQKQVLMTNIWNSTESTKQSSTTICWKNLTKKMVNWFWLPLSTRHRPVKERLQQL